MGADLSLRVTGTGRAENLIWDAVEEAQIEGWSSKRFVAEFREAWEECRNRETEQELKDFA